MPLLFIAVKQDMQFSLLALLSLVWVTTASAHGANITELLDAIVVAPDKRVNISVHGEDCYVPIKSARLRFAFPSRNAMVTALQTRASRCTLRCLDWNNDPFRVDCANDDAKCLCTAEVYNNDWTECMCDNCHGQDVKDMLGDVLRFCFSLGTEYTITPSMKGKLFDALTRDFSPSGY